MAYASHTNIGTAKLAYDLRYALPEIDLNKHVYEDLCSVDRKLQIESASRLLDDADPTKRSEVDCTGAVVSKKMKIPREYRRLIIDEGGTTINRLRDESVAQIKVANNANGTVEVELMGTDSQITKASRMILDVIALEEIRDCAPLSPSIESAVPSKKIKIPNARIGLIHQNIDRLRNESGAKMKVLEPTNPDKYVVQVTGSFGQITKADQLIKDVLAQYGSSDCDHLSCIERRLAGFSSPWKSVALPLYNDVPSPSKRTRVDNGAGGGGGFDSTDAVDAVVSKKMKIPRDYCRLIVDESGATNNRFWNESVAQIKVTNNTNGTVEVELLGTESQITRARRMILDVIALEEIRDCASLPPFIESAVPSKKIKIPNARISVIHQNINSLQNESGAKVKVLELTNPDHYVIQVTGHFGQITKADQLIKDVLARM